MNDSPPEYDADQLIAPTPKRSSGVLAPLIIVVAVILLVAAAFLGGYVIADDGESVSEELAEAEDRIDEAEDDRSAAVEALELTEERLGRMRFNYRLIDSEWEEFRTFPRYTPSIAGYGEFDWDYGWKAWPQEIGYLTLKPLTFKQRNGIWVLRTRVTNHERWGLTPFCSLGTAELAVSSGEIYRSEPMAGNRIVTDNPYRYRFCKELPPGDTAVYKTGFQLPVGADPKIVSISGVGRLSERARVWELP